MLDWLTIMIVNVYVKQYASRTKYRNVYIYMLLYISRGVKKED